MGILVLHASHFGQTRKIAERIAEELRALGHPVDLGDVRRGTPPAPVGYDAVVLGSRVEVGRHAPEMLAYIRNNVAVLGTKPTAFFSVSMAASRDRDATDPDGYMTAMFTDVGWQPTRARAFAGGLPYRKYGWFLRWMMKRINKSAGSTTDTSRNHELTDWSRVAAFAVEIGAMIGAPATSPIRATSSKGVPR